MQMPCYLVFFFTLLITGLAGAAPPKLEVTVEGVSGALRENILAALSIQQQKTNADLSPDRLRFLHHQAAQEIRVALQPFGYYQARVQSELLKQGSGWHARYRVDPGAPLKVGLLDVRLIGAGRDDPELVKLVEAFPLQQGDTLNHARYEAGKEALQKSAAQRGYFDARLTLHEVRVDMEKYSAQVVLHYDTGIRYQFGELSFQQEGFSEDFLRRFVPFKTGDPYSTDRLLELQTALSDSDYFTRVEVAPRREQARAGSIPVVVRLEPKKPNKYAFGIGYGTDTGARASAAWERRRINEHGHRLDAKAEVSQISYRLTGGYRIPIGNPRTDQLAFTASAVDEETGAQQNQTATIGVSQTRARGAWLQILSLNFQHELYQVGDVEGRADLLIPGASWSRTQADSRSYTTHGSRVQLDVRGATEGLLSDTSFLQGHAQGKLIRKLGSAGRLLLRGNLGYTQVADIETLPVSIRFFAGGDQSVRGYDYRTLGPRNAAGEVIGGKYLLVGSAEYEHRIKEKWGAALFYDAGNALNELSDPLRHSVGVGVRWRSPVGLVRVDVAAPLSESEDSVRLHLTIGPDL